MKYTLPTSKNSEIFLKGQFKLKKNIGTEVKKFHYFNIEINLAVRPKMLVWNLKAKEVLGKYI